jgi:hypothetical protein
MGIDFKWQGHKLKHLKPPLGAEKIKLRRAAAQLLAARGYKIKERTGKGIRPAARLTATSADGSSLEVAVRIGSERSIGITRLRNGKFRTLDVVDQVLAIVPDEERAADYQVFAFDSKTLKTWYGQALDELNKADRSPELDVPVFIPFDERSKKNVGHNIVGLRKAELWSASISAKELKDQNLSDASESFIDRVKREFAERNEVDVTKVSVEFRILA